MKLLAAFLILTTIPACSTMSPEQLRASAGLTTCTTTTNIWGKVSVITQAVDDTRKGATSENTTEIVCGDAKMSQGNKVGVPVPAGATTITTTTVKPAP